MTHELVGADGRQLRVDGHREVLLRTGEQPVNGALVPRNRTPHESVIPTIDSLDIDSLDVESLPRFDTVHSPEFCRQSRTIWPLEDTVVFTKVRYRPTVPPSSNLTRRIPAGIGGWEPRVHAVGKTTSGE